MRRTIAINPNNIPGVGGDLFYKNRKVDYLASSIRDYFKLYDGYKYTITIVEGEGYKFVISSSVNLYDIYADSRYVGYICLKRFNKIFFVPDVTKSYKITVKRID